MSLMETYLADTVTLVQENGWDQWGTPLAATEQDVRARVGHYLEENNPSFQKAARDFLARRTKGEKALPLAELTGDSRYGPHEAAKKDRFSHPYIGKIYEDGATEIISMGLQQMYQDPRLFAKTAPEYFNLMVRLLSGGQVQ